MIDRREMCASSHHLLPSRCFSFSLVLIHYPAHSRLYRHFFLFSYTPSHLSSLQYYRRHYFPKPKYPLFFSLFPDWRRGECAAARARVSFFHRGVFFCRASFFCVSLALPLSLSLCLSSSPPLSLSFFLPCAHAFCFFCPPVCVI